MIIIDPNELFFAGQDGETITVVVRSVNTRHAVNAVLDNAAQPMTPSGTQSSRLVFTLNQAANDPSHLVMIFQFFNQMGGGLYRVVISGDRSTTSFGMMVQQFSSVVTAKIFTFDVI